MKKHFITGLALLLPAVVTILVFLFIINFLTKPFVGIVEYGLDYYDLLDKPALFFTRQQVITFFSKFFILIALFFFVVLIGFLGRLVVFHYLLRFGNFIIHKIPFINKIYKAAQDVIGTIFQDKTTNFSQVVLIPFPTSESLSVGFVTNDPESSQPSQDRYGNVSVFVPATPNPTIGFMLLFKKSQLIFIDMSVEDALKFVISCGVMATELKVKITNDGSSNES